MLTPEKQGILAKNDHFKRLRKVKIYSTTCFCVIAGIGH